MPQSLTYRLLSQSQATSANTTAVTSITVPKYASAIEMGAQGQDAYVSFDGTDPSSTHGFRLIAGAQPKTFNFLPDISTVAAIKVVSQTASTSSVDYAFLQ